MGRLRMPVINQVWVSARLVREPMFGETAAGVFWARADMVLSARKTDMAGKWKKNPTFFNAFGSGSAAQVLKQLHKGNPVLIDGTLQNSLWINESKGIKRRSLNVCIQRIYPLEWMRYLHDDYEPNRPAQIDPIDDLDMDVVRLLFEAGDDGDFKF